MKRAVQAPNARVELYRGYIDAAQKLREFRRDDQSNASLEREVIEIIDDKLFETRTAKLIRWAVPVVLAAVFGGVVWGTFEVRGALDAIQKRFAAWTAEIEKSRNTAINEIAAMTKDVDNSRISAIKQIGKVLGSEKDENTALWRF